MKVSEPLRIAVIHGPNLNLLGSREPDKYGQMSLSAINQMLQEVAEANGAVLSVFQSNSEGDLVTFIQTGGAESAGILINPGAYTHTSVAIRDALLAVDRPTVEVHLTNPDKRESFRHRSLIADIVEARIAGFGAESYRLGLLGLLANLEKASE